MKYRYANKMYKTQVEPLEFNQLANMVLFPSSWSWPQIFDWLQKQNRDVSWWEQAEDGRPECHLKPIGSV